MNPALSHMNSWSRKGGVKEHAVLATIVFSKSAKNAKDSSEELAELSKSAGLSVAQNLIYKQRVPNAPLLLGRGQVEFLKKWAEEENADVVVFDNNLSPSQQRNLEEILEIKTIDRTQLILDIFAARARSIEGKLQVELAQLKYLLPRLPGKGIYLSRLGGGVGTRGPGEQKLEVDRRRIRERIALLGHRLETVEKRRLADIQRKKEKELPLVTLVGYTNAGKSSLFNALTRSSTLVKDKLFSTLDTTTRLLTLPGGQKALLADTVGFIRDLPHTLIESFKATLEETIHADILLHVVDSNLRDFLEREKAVNQVLSELNVRDKKTLIVMNKIDLLGDKRYEKMSFNAGAVERVWVSALTGEGIERLLERIPQSLPRWQPREIFIPNEHPKLVNFLYENAEVTARRDEPSGVYLTLNISLKTEQLLRKKLTAC